jgi:hypothetical protein
MEVLALFMSPEVGNYTRSKMKDEVSITILDSRLMIELDMLS